jgi:hypothetical protein
MLYYLRFCDEELRRVGRGRRARALFFDFAFSLDGDRRVARLIILRANETSNCLSRSCSLPNR